MKITLRSYQIESLKGLVAYLKYSDGNPLLVLPTGAGKSIIIAEFCQGVLRKKPGARVAMVTHVRELIQQNAEKLLSIWPMAPLGIFSAGLKSKNLKEQITFAGIQSIVNAKIDYYDYVLIDEAHLIPKNEDTRYQKFLTMCKAKNPRTKFIGLTATPYRTSSGLITGEGGIFDDIAYEVQVQELIDGGYLCAPVSRPSKVHFDLSNIKTIAGDFSKKELDEVVNIKGKNSLVINEIIEYGKDRKSWLIFATSVAHANALCDELEANFIKSAIVTGETPSKTRDLILKQFKSGEIKALCNCNVLTTGFDHPGVDLIGLVRPTKSPGLYVQMVGRGLRIAEGKKDCLILDFGQNVTRHGPIDSINIKEKGKGDGAAPVKLCEGCGIYVHAAVRLCPGCGFIFPEPESKIEDKSAEDAILKSQMKDTLVKVLSSFYIRNTGKNGKPDSIRCEYDTDYQLMPILEWVCPDHQGYAGQKGRQWMTDRKLHDEDGKPIETVDDFFEILTNSEDFPKIVDFVGHKGKGGFWKFKKINFAIDKNPQYSPTGKYREAAEISDDDLPF